MNDLSAAGNWNTAMSYEPSNYREIMGILLSLQTFKDHLHNKSVELLTDNVTALSYIVHKGGPILKYHNVAKAIWSLATEINLNIQCHHLAGKLNTEADYLSRIKDSYNWELSQGCFHKLECLFGPHSVDRFADFQNSKVTRYNARFADPKAEGINALA